MVKKTCPVRWLAIFVDLEGAWLLTAAASEQQASSMPSKSAPGDAAYTLRVSHVSQRPGILQRSPPIKIVFKVKNWILLSKLGLRGGPHFWIYSEILS